MRLAFLHVVFLLTGLCVAVAVAPVILIVFAEGVATLQEHFLAAEGFFPASSDATVISEVLAGDLVPADCQRIVHVRRIIDFAPAAENLRSTCTAAVAAAFRDAKLCQALLPSERALACMGDVEELHIADMRLPEYYPKRAMHGCDASRGSTLRTDRCSEHMAYAHHDPAMCAPIHDATIREVCRLQLLAWIIYPELRKSTYYGIYRAID